MSVLRLPPAGGGPRLQLGACEAEPRVSAAGALRGGPAGGLPPQARQPAGGRGLHLRPAQDRPLSRHHGDGQVCTRSWEELRDAYLLLFIIINLYFFNYCLYFITVYFYCLFQWN